MIKKNQKILIIGGAGFIGSHLSRALFDLGYKVVIIDNFSSDVKKENYGNCKIYKANIDDPAKIRLIFKKEKPNAVYHLAGAINLRRSVKDPLFSNSLNILGRTKIILDCCLKNKIKKIVFFSSASVYGDAKIVPTPESYACHPESIYGLANLLIEKYIKNYCEGSSLNYTILRLSNVYGPRQWASGIIPSFIYKISRGENSVISGDGEQTRDFIYVTDVAKAAILSLEKGNKEIYNIASGKDIAINSVFRLVQEFFNSKTLPNYINKKGSEDQKRSALNIKKADRELGWRPETKLKDGILKTIKCFKN